MDLYIYYRIRPEHAGSMQQRVSALQQSLSQEYGIVCALKRRPQDNGGLQTWMEIYEMVPEGFDVALERAVVEAGLMPLTEGRRNTEFFVDV